MHIPLRKPLVQALIVGGLISAPILSGSVLAQEVENVQQSSTTAQAKQYNISAGSLSQVLSEFAGQAGILLSGDAQITMGKTSPGLKGRYSVSQALNQLLKNTDVSFNRQGDTVTLVPANADVMTLNPVRISGSLLHEKQSVIGTSVGISKERLDVIKPRSLKEIFSAVSSVSVGGSTPITQKLYVRGVEETALAVRVDGARQNNKIFHHNATTLIDPALLKSVRTSAGVAAADDGPGAIGGSAAFETVDVSDLLDEGDNFGGFVDASYDSNSKTFTTGLSSFAKKDGFEVLGFVNKAAGDNYKDGNGDRVKFSEADLLSGLAKVAYEAESGDRFELSFELVNDDSLRPYRANFSGLTVGRPVPESRQYDLERTNTVFNYSNQKDRGLWNPKVVVAQSESNLVTTEEPLAAPGTALSYNGVTRSQSIVAENLFITDFVEITAGGDFYKDSAQFKQKGATTLGEEVENTGAFIQLRQTLNSVWDLSYGARYDSQNFTGTDGSRQSDSGASSNFSVEFDVNPNLTLKAGYADVWGGVVLAENFILNSAWDYSAGIKPVRSNNSVLGFESNFERFRFGANYYETEIADARVPNYGGGPGLLADFDIRGHDIYVGYYEGRDELSIKYSDITTKRDGSAATSYAGNYFTVPLGEQIALNAIKGFDDLNLLVGATVEHALENDNIGNGLQKQESYTVVDIFAEYEHSEKFVVRLAVNNLTDENYTDRASYGQEFATVNTLLEQGRSFLLSGRYEF
jgi:hemoglobin/transferrin/lactoferrin receptor protein